MRTTAASTQDDKVIDLMSRLRESLAEGKKKPARAARTRKKTPTRRRKSA
jgi:non-homologous end joining protein Ku